ncbi:MAG: DUF2157 domain-containing protein [Ferruginibacter sp.]
MNAAIFDKLKLEGLLSASSVENIQAQKATQLFSVHWEIRTILYLGISLLTGGLGILVYKNIDSLSHQFVLLFIALICAASFFYCFKKKLPFSFEKVKAPNAFFDYILLLGCLTFIIFIAYFQYQYNIFGNRYGLATFIPMLLLFFTAYYFDHLAVLSLAITNLAAWLGISVTPLQILQENDFNSNTIILVGIVLGIFLVTVGLASLQKNIKAHFEFTYTNFGIHILFISLLAAMFQFDGIHLIIFLALIAVAFYFYKRAIKEQSFYLLLVSTLYAYIGFTYVFINMLSYSFSSGVGIFYLGFIYFIASGIALILFLMRTNKKFKAS